MPLFEYIAFSIIGVYSIIILGFAFGWKKLKTFKINQEFKPIFVSIVVACRNEEGNIGPLLESLSKQNYPEDKFEIIIVDDHSEDETISIVKKFISQFKNLKLFHQSKEKQGKKDAVAFGIENSISDVIITTDADCQMGKNWLKSMVSYYEKNKPNLLSGPVIFKESTKLFQKFQALEFLSLVGTGAGAIGIYKPIMNNGANLLFEKSLFFESDLQNEFTSGDDIFLLLHEKRSKKNSIQFIKSKDAIVHTKAVKTLKEFFNQRIRWTSKSKAYKDFDIIFTALIVAFTNLLLVFAFILSFWKLESLIFFLILFLIKSIVDLIILAPVTSYFNQSKLLWLFFPLQIIYPFYITLTVIWGLAGNFQWKGRNYGEKR